MNKSEALDFARTQWAQHDDEMAGWTFVFDARPKNRMGQCRHAVKEIGLSEIALKMLDDDGVRDVILHELAHALVGPGHGHDAVWQAKARQVGARPRSKAANSALRDDYKPDWLWTGTCPSCGHEYGRNKLTARVKNGALCSKCTTRDPIRWRKNR